MMYSKSIMQREKGLLLKQPRWWDLTCHMSQRWREEELLRKNEQTLLVLSLENNALLFQIDIFHNGTRW